MNQRLNIFWFRRDLRLHDNRGLFEALTGKLPVLPVFIFDTEILTRLSEKKDARVSFIHSVLLGLKAEIENFGSSIRVFYCSPLEAFQQLTADYEIDTVFTNTDYEPYALQRDLAVKNFLVKSKVHFRTFTDHVIFKPGEVVKENNEPYTVFTPYSKKWKSKLDATHLSSFQSENHVSNFIKATPFSFPELNEIGFEKSDLPIPKMDISAKLISNYAETRDLPAVNGTSKLGVHLRFGTVSIREITRIAQNLSEVFLNELIWRNFFIDILWHFPYVEKKSFKPKYDLIEWQNKETDFEKWCSGKTGYPMVDAGMRELNATGFMHNRVRMVVASFLVKHLLIDWRWGETYFAEKLHDFELASNNGNWQWAAGCGCDAAPYFRVFNPESQQQKFDAEGKYILKWVPEYGTLNYPKPIVDHKFARERVLDVFKKALK